MHKADFPLDVMSYTVKLKQASLLNRRWHQYYAILMHKTYNKWTLQGLCTFKDSAETPLTLFSNVILKWLFQIDALSDQLGIVL